MLWMSHTGCSKCNMKLIQQPEKKKLILKQKEQHSALAQQILFV